MIDTKAIRAAAEAATPGPWFAAGPSFGAPLPKYINCVVVENEDGDPDDICIAPIGCDSISTDDLTYIATANPEAVITLLDRLEAAEAEVLEQARLLGISGGKELALMAKLEAAEKDAARYRAIAADPYFDGYAWWTQDICIIESDDQNKPPTKAQVDAAVDAAMKEQK